MTGGAGRVAASVVVPTWNGAPHLPTCLESLRAQRGVRWVAPGAEPASGEEEGAAWPPTAFDVELVVVDNGSTDGSLDLLARYPEARVLALPRNLGFARAVNAGIRASRGDALVLLNNDTEAEPTWLAELLGALEHDPTIGAATSRIRLFDRRDRLHTTGDFVDAAGMAESRGVWELDVGQHDDAREVFGASAAAAAYRRALLEDIGLFEEAFGSYYEDVDLAVRARLAGWRTVYVPEAVVYHKLSATGGGAYASYRVARNRVWMLARCWPGALLRRHAWAIARAQATCALDALRHWRGAAARATLRGLVVGWLTWPRWVAARQRILRRRRVVDAALAVWLAPPGA